MAKFLLTVWPIPGHCNPNMAIALALRDRGHEVAFLTGARAIPTIAGEGFECFTFQSIADEWIDQVFYPLARGRSRWRQFRTQHSRRRDLLVGKLREQIADLGVVLKAWKADVIVVDPAIWGACLVLHEQGDVPVVMFDWALLCFVPGPDVPPVGLGLPPPRSWPRKVQCRVADLLTKLLTRNIRREADKVRQEHGLPPLSTTVAEFIGGLPLYLVCSSPELDYDRRDLPPSVRYVGPCIWPRSNDQEPAPWLGMLPRDVPWVHVSEGTIHREDPFVLRAAADGLAACPVQVVMTTGGSREPGDLGLGPLPQNVRLERWVLYDHLLPLTDVVVTTGGAGTVAAALMAGVPLVIIPTEWEKPDNAQRVVEAGAGLRLSPRSCTPSRLREAVEKILADPSFRSNAERLALSFARCGGPVRAAELLERVIAVRPALERASS